MDKRRFNAYRRRLIALKKARQAYIDAEVEHLRFRKFGSDGKFPGRTEQSFRDAIYRACLKVEIANLKAVNATLPHVDGDHYDGDGCV
jgi:hypothetical protein